MKSSKTSEARKTADASRNAGIQSRSQTGAPWWLAVLLVLLTATAAHAEVGNGLSSLFNVDTRWGGGTSFGVSGFFTVDTRFSGSTGEGNSGLFTVDTTGAAIGSATISGYVRDASNAGLSGATVSALQNGVLRAQTATDPWGNYSLLSLPEGAYEVRAAKANYLTANRYGVTAVASQTAVQNFWLASNPAAPVMVAVVRPYEPLATVTITSPQLKKFVGGAFTNSYTLDLSKKTVVFTHGWNSNPEVWATNMAANMVAGGVTNANLLAWDWHEAAGMPEPSRALNNVPEQSKRLGRALTNVLQTGYSQPIHFIGHSLGTLVNAGAANYLHTNGFDWHRTHMTLLDEGEMANGIPLGVIVTGVEALGGRTEAPTLGWLTPDPDDFGWMDNYISLVGVTHPYAVNVWLGQGIDRANRNNWVIDYFAEVHRYACEWYGVTALNPNSSIMGHRNSFERLGSGVDLKALSPYSDASLLAQDIYPFNPYPLHELTGGGVASYVEFNAAVFRQLSMTTIYATDAFVEPGVHVVTTGAMIGINTLNGIGQTVGNVYMDGIEATGAVVADTSIWAYQTASSLGSQFFNSFRAVLHSGSGAGGQLRALNGLHPNGLGDASNVPPAVWLPIQVPTNAVVMAFDFTFTGDAGDDVVSASINSTNVFALAATYIPTNQTMHSGSIDVRRWSGQTVELFFGLLGGTTTNATLTVEAMRFYTLAAPFLTAQISGSNAIIQWPLSANGYVLEMTDDLVATNSWMTVTNAPTIVDLQNTVTNPISGGKKFYRLRK